MEVVADTDPKGGLVALAASGLGAAHHTGLADFSIPINAVLANLMDVA